jgi:hypothetical protein
MTLLRITVSGGALPPTLGDWPLEGPQHRLTLDPALTLASAASAVRLALRANPAAWVIVQGRAVAPFVSAVTADLSLAVAGAFLLTPQSWAARPLELAPLSFPSVVVTGLPNVTVKTHANAWGAILLSPDNLFAHAQVHAIIDRRSRDLARTTGPRLFDAPYAAVAGSTPG